MRNLTQVENHRFLYQYIHPNVIFSLGLLLSTFMGGTMWQWEGQLNESHRPLALYQFNRHEFIADLENNPPQLIGRGWLCSEFTKELGLKPRPLLLGWNMARKPRRPPSALAERRAAFYAMIEMA